MMTFHESSTLAQIAQKRNAGYLILDLSNIKHPAGKGGEILE